jgi:hypothetical protein
MAYDPKKTRAKQTDEDGVVDEILEEDVVTAKVKPLLEVVEDANISRTPLFMKPQVWLPLVAGVIATLFVVLKRRK